jgi:hypothetical protein
MQDAVWGASSIPILNIHFFYSLNIDTGGLHKHDQLIVERLVLKKWQQGAFEARATFHRQNWKAERDHLEYDRKNQSLIWEKHVLAKRRLEAETNEARLLETRRRLIQCQDQLRWLIRQKDERSKELVIEAQR